MKKCDVILKSIANCSEERIEKVEVTTVKDVIETTVWLDETKFNNIMSTETADIAENREEELSRISENEGEENIKDYENDADISNYFELTEEEDLTNKNDRSATLGVEEKISIDSVVVVCDNRNENSTSKNCSIEVIDNRDNNEPTKVNNNGDKNEPTKINFNGDKKDTKLLENQDNTNAKQDEDFFIPCKTKNIKSNHPTSLKYKTTSPALRNHNKHQHRELEQITYMHPNFTEYDKITKKYFKFIQRYHIADTLPIYFKGQLQMQLRAAGVNFLTLGLFGAPGAGKSSFLNSLYTAMNGHYVEYSAERKLGVGRDLVDAKSATNQRIELRLTETITVLDNRATDFSKNSMREIVKQCEGFRENGSLVPKNWDIGFKQRFKDFFEDCSKLKVFRNRIQTPIIINSLEDEVFNIGNYKLLVSTIIKVCGFSPIIILTHADNITEKKRITERTRDFEELHCPRVYAVGNYTHKSREFDKNIDAKMIEILFNCCLVGDQEMQYLMKNLNNSCCCN